LAANSDDGHRVAKKRIGQRKAKIAADHQPGTQGATQFIELSPLAGPSTSWSPIAAGGPSRAGGRGECCVELEDGCGAVMRVRLQGIGMPDLAVLTRAFLDRTMSGNERP
jgi:hypothetical protein